MSGFYNPWQPMSDPINLKTNGLNLNPRVQPPLALVNPINVDGGVFVFAKGKSRFLGGVQATDYQTGNAVCGVLNAPGLGVPEVGGGGVRHLT